ncbi:Uncharacterised protein [uncultured archaeon]|nr:Uncharacterised protein [uncultured archaeon]
MATPKNVLMNNRVRASIVGPGELKESILYYKEKSDDFIKQHQSTCAVYEVIMITKNGDVYTISKLMCPLCKQELDITNYENP